MNILFNSFTLHRLTFTAISFFWLFVAMVFFDVSVGKSVALYSYFAGLFSFGVGNHFRRYLDFYHSYGAYTYLVIFLNIFAAIFFVFFEAKISFLSVSKMSVVLGCIFMPSLVIFEVSIYAISRFRLYIIDFISLLIFQALIIIFQNDYVWIVTVLLAQFKLILILRFWPRVSDTDKRQDPFHFFEFAYSLLSTIFAVIPPLIVTSIFLNADTSGGFWVLFLLRLTSGLTLISNASFNYVKSKFGSATRLVPASYLIYSSLIFLLVELFVFFSVQIGLVNEMIYVSLIPFLAFSGTWAKQNIQYEIGSSPILIFNFSLTLCCSFLALSESGVLYFYVTFVVFYTIGINFWYYWRHST